jgi:hypothetical protein
MATYFTNSALGVRMLRRARSPERRKKITNIHDIYEFRIWNDLERMDSILYEIRTLLKLMPSLAISCESALVCRKFYVLSVYSLLNALGQLMNTFFDLGLHPEDLDLEIIFRNSFVRKTELPELFEKFKDKIGYKNIRGWGNQIVKKGILLDVEIEAIREKLTGNATKMLLNAIMGSDNIKDGFYDPSSDLQSYSSQKQTEFNAHLDGVIIMIDEIIMHLNGLKVPLRMGD